MSQTVKLLWVYKLSIPPDEIITLQNVFNQAKKKI